jgi:hypothetical protein
MSRTVIDIIKRAYRLIGVYSIGETPSADESIDGLSSLNAMLDEWATEKLMTYVQTLDSIPLTAGVSVYTLGASGTIVTIRPDTINNTSYIESQGISYPLTLLTLDEYNALTQKSISANIPTMIWYNPTFPNGTLTVCPIPSTPSTLKLWSMKPVSYINLTDVMALPPAYENAITMNLACHLAIEFSVSPSPLLIKNAALAKTKIKHKNYEPSILEVHYPMRGRFNITTGAFQ